MSRCGANLSCALAATFIADIAVAMAPRRLAHQDARRWR